MTILATNKTLVLTGMTAGFGQKALELIANKASCKIIVGARNQDAVPKPIKDRVTWVPLDLSSLQSVAAFCEAAKAAGPIGGMALNAGLSPRTLRKTEDGFDLAFQTNYLSHFAMIQALWDHLTDAAHITITSSGTHDPAEKTPPPPPRHANAAWLADPDTDPGRDRGGAKAASRSYTASKLCCTMLSLELAQRRPNGTSISFDPGLVPGTRLTREFPGWLIRVLMPVMTRMMPADRTSSIPASANALAQLMAQTSLMGTNGDYVAMRGGYGVVVHPSEMARDADLRTVLWRDSVALLQEAQNWPVPQTLKPNRKDAS